MIKQILEQSEYQPFSLYLMEKAGKPILIKGERHVCGLDFETEEEARRPIFTVIEHLDVTPDADLDTFVQAVINGTHDAHPLSLKARHERSLVRQKQCEEAEEEQRTKGKH